MKYFLFLILPLVAASYTEAQILKRLKDKINQVGDKAVDRKVSDAAGTKPPEGTEQQNSGAGNLPTQKAADLPTARPRM